MKHKVSAFPKLQQEYLLSDGSPWRMLKKDLRQMIEMPSHFESKKHKKLATGCNLSLMMVATGGLEAMATLANIGGAGSDATVRVTNFMSDYFPKVNSRWGMKRGNESMVSLVWDAYRNGGLHRFLPKKQEFKVKSNCVQLDFGVCWSETRLPLPLKDIQKRWRRVAKGQDSATKHLQFKRNDDGSINFWVSAPYFSLELEAAVENWINHLAGDEIRQTWFACGVKCFESGLELGSKKDGVDRANASKRPWLAQMIEDAMAPHS
jgi:hypothetical protein